MTYSDAIRLLVEEALAARAGRENAIVSKLDAMILHMGVISESQDMTQGRVESQLAAVVKIVQLLNVTTDLWREALHRDEDTMKEIRNETARILHGLSGWPVWNANQVREMAEKIDAMRWQIEKVLDLPAEKV